MLQAPSAVKTRQRRETKRRSGTHFSPSRVTSPAALFMKTADDTAPEEQVVHNVIPLKDKMPPLRFSDVQRKAKSSLTATFVRCQSGASRPEVRGWFVGGFFKNCRAEETPTSTNSTGSINTTRFDDQFRNISYTTTYATVNVNKHQQILYLFGNQKWKISKF